MMMAKIARCVTTTTNDAMAQRARMLYRRACCGELIDGNFKNKYYCIIQLLTALDDYCVDALCRVETKSRQPRKEYEISVFEAPKPENIRTDLILLRNRIHIHYWQCAVSHAVAVAVRVVAAATAAVCPADEL